MTIIQLLMTLTRYFKPYKFSMVVILLILLSQMAFDAGVNVSFKFIIDEALIGKNLHLLVWILAILGFSVILITVLTIVGDYLYSRLFSQVLSNIRQKLFRNLQFLSLDFYAKNNTGDIIARFSTDLAAVENALVAAIPWGIYPSLDILGSIILLFTLDWRLALIALLVIPMSLTGPRIFAPKATAASYRRKKDEAAVLGMIHENLAAHVTIANFGLEHHVIDQFSMQNSVLTRSIRHLNYMSSLVEGSSYIGAMLLQIIILGVGAWMVATGWMTVGSLVSFQLIFLSLSASLTYVSQYAPTLVQATGGMARIEEILAIRPYVADAPDAVEQARLHHAIEFKNITFGYTQDAPILKNVSFTIPKGSYVAFVGLSGSGKSTILNLLSRSFDPQEGEIRIDGLDLRKVTLASHRYRIGVVAQENFLFNLSLKENIRLGKLQATDAEIEAAARLAELHDVITALPDGYETFAGERGSRLSGGQRQRIAISRALLRNPDILLLDEATSALDPATEAEINRTIDHLRQGTTIIMVTHRLASVGNCDQIFVMAQGEVCESGNFAELLEKGGMFKSIFDKQSGFEFSMDGRFAQIIPSRLGEFPLFKTVPKELLAELTLLFVTEHYRPDQVVIQEGDLDDKFYVIARGKVDVMKTLKNGMRIKLATYADGDHFGQIALLHNIPRTADVITTTYCTLLSMRRQKFNYVMKKVPQAYDILMKSSLSMLEEDAVYTTPQ